MKKYKLIKEYPGSLLLGSEVIMTDTFRNPNITLYPDFWEEIKACNLIVDKWHKIYFFNSNKIYYLKPFDNKKNRGESLVLIGDSKTYTYYSKDSWDCNDIKSAEVLTDLTEIQNYLPDYHKDKFKKDYEILSFKSKSDNYKGINIVVLDKNGNYSWYHPEAMNKSVIGLEKFINNDNWIIHSVERLSDGEVFTIGDKLDMGNKKIDPILKIEYEKGHITNDSESCGKEFWYEDHLWVITKEGSTQLKYIKKAKQPLFKTEDGVDIYAGNIYYNVWEKGFRNESKPFEIKGPHIAIEIKDDFITYNKKCKYFSTKEAAEKWVLMNKPSLSINDILDNYEKDGMLDFMKFSNKLIKLVKSKS